MNRTDEVVSRVRMKMELDSAELEACRALVRAVPEEAAERFASCLEELLAAHPLKVVEQPSPATTDAGDLVIRLRVAGALEVFTAALRAVNGEGAVI